MSDRYENEGKTMNRKALLTGFAIVALGLIVAGVGLTCLQQAAPGTPIIDIPSIPNIIGSSGPYVLAAPFPDVNDSYPVYRTIPPNTSTEEIRRIGNRFEVSGELKPVPSDNVVRLVDDSKDPVEELRYYTNSGAFTYSIPGKLHPKFPDGEAVLPSDKETRAIATNYLQERGLLSDNVYFESVSVRDRYGHVTPTSHTVYNLTKHVSFVQEIQGIRVYGAGVGLTINERGEVVSAGSTLRKFDPKPVRDVKIVTPEQAYQRLSSGNVVIQPLPEDYDKIVVTNISLGYWMETKTEPQKYIVPVYVFSGLAVWDGKSEEIVRYVSAIDPSEVQDLT
jgi:hypothetical protein